MKYGARANLFKDLFWMGKATDEKDLDKMAIYCKE